MRAFDNDNPWHVSADFMFGFQCEYCEIQIDLNDAKSDDYTEQCVEMSEKAQEEGWVYIDDFVFICKSCSDKRNANKNI